MGKPSSPAFAPRVMLTPSLAATGFFHSLAQLVISSLRSLVTSVDGVLRILGVTQLFVLVGLLWKRSDPPVDGVVAQASAPARPQTTQPSNSFNRPGDDLPHAQGIQTRGAVGPIHSLTVSRRLEHSDSRAHTRRCRHRCTPVAAARSFSTETSELRVALLNVAHLRRSAQHNRYRPEPMKMMKLADALERLSPMLAQAGRTREALESSRESAELYRDLPRMMHQSHHYTR